MSEASVTEEGHSDHTHLMLRTIAGDGQRGWAPRREAKERR